MRRIGHVVGVMHKAGVIHGDLTTSNLILRPVLKRDGRDENEGEDTTTATITATDTSGKPSLDGEVVLIDFGLASQGMQDEDRAVDLYVLERAFGSTHPLTEAFFKEVLNAYGQSFRGARTVLKKLEEVRMRGRKRSMVG
jgi:TP53 regulating kinase-like protein